MHSFVRQLLWNSDRPISENIALFWSNWYVQDAIVALLVGLAAWVSWTLCRRDYWRAAFRQVLQRPLVKLCFGVLCIYMATALVDSVGYHPPLRNDDGALRRHPETGSIIWDDAGTSLLDLLLIPLRNVKEETYSAPLAARQFTKQTFVDAEGGVLRGYPELKHPRRHLMGTDRVGTDVLYLGVKGVRTGIVIGAFTTLLVIPFALAFGVVAGYFGGWVDDVIQYVYTVLASIPSILLIVAFMIILGQGLAQLCIVMGITSWTGLCRVLRGETLKLREADYVQACEAMGVSHLRIIGRHIVPNLMHIVLISAVLSFSGRVLAEAVLTYIGIGVGAETMSWGVMINDARLELARDPIIWWKLCTAFVLMIGLVLPVNVFGDAMRDALDPRLRTE